MAEPGGWSRHVSLRRHYPDRFVRSAAPAALSARSVRAPAGASLTLRRLRRGRKGRATRHRHPADKSPFGDRDTRDHESSAGEVVPAEVLAADGDTERDRHDGY